MKEISSLNKPSACERDVAAIHGGHHSRKGLGGRKSVGGGALYVSVPANFLCAVDPPCAFDGGMEGQVVPLIVRIHRGRLLPAIKAWNLQKLVL